MLEKLHESIDDMAVEVYGDREKRRRKKKEREKQRRSLEHSASAPEEGKKDSTSSKLKLSRSTSSLEESGTHQPTITIIIPSSSLPSLVPKLMILFSCRL